MKPTLLVLAAGMGSRYGGVKQIEAVGTHDETLLDYAVYDAFKGGFGKVVFVIRKDIEADFRERLFNRIAQHGDAAYVFQGQDSLLSAAQAAQAKNRKKPWGTIHAVLCAKEELGEPFAVINADDYYGRSAYEVMADHLSALANDSTEHAMVSYLLKNTMSRSGSVSRGVCEISDGYLRSMREHTKISYTQEGGSEKIVSLLDDGAHILTGDEPVSMNLFGFTPAALAGFEAYFAEFIAREAGSEKSECLLPEGASMLTKTGQGSIKVYTSSEQWFGMTYPADREIVRTEIAAKVRSGYYPENLW